MQDLTHRMRRILFAVVTEFIAHGDPVGSRTLARRYGLDLSAASIRNVLADLEEAGYLAQPHTSAGRVPTERALRFFIDALLEVQSLPEGEKANLAQRFAEIYSTADDPLRETGRYLSDLSGAAAVVSSSGDQDEKALAQLRFISVQPDKLLAVLVFEDGSVENRFIEPEGDVDESDLGRIHELLHDVIEGRSLGELREFTARRLADDRLSVGRLRHRAFRLTNDAVSAVQRRGQIAIEGQSKLFDKREYADVEQFKALMAILEDRTELLGLLDRTLEANAVTVIVGSEAKQLGSDLSLVVAPYRRGDKAVGAVGVIGPTRMDYGKMMPLVDATAEAMSEALRRKE